MLPSTIAVAQDGGDTCNAVSAGLSREQERLQEMVNRLFMDQSIRLKEDQRRLQDALRFHFENAMQQAEDEIRKSVSRFVMPAESKDTSGNAVDAANTTATATPSRVASAGDVKSKSHQALLKKMSIDRLAQKGRPHTKAATTFLQGVAKACVENPAFNYFSTTIIILNAVFMAISSDDYITKCTDFWKSFPVGETLSLSDMPGSPTWIYVADVFFACAFTLELVIVLAYKRMDFIKEDGKLWNILDAVCVISSWVDVLASGAVNLSFLRLFRLLKVFRALRIIRVLKVLHELRVTLVSLLGSIRPLFWTLVTIAMLVFVFDVLLIQALAQAIIEVPGGDSSVADMLYHFGSFGKVFLALILAITGGQDWGIYHEILGPLSWVIAGIFIFYVLAMILGVLNVITGIFVENATAKAQADWEISKHENQQRNMSKIQKLRELFLDIDTDGTGSVSKEEWLSFMNTPDAAASFAALDLDIAAFTSDEFFSCVDLDGSGVLELEELILGCVHIMSMDSSLNEDTLIYHNKQLLADIERCVRMCIDSKISIQCTSV